MKPSFPPRLQKHRDTGIVRVAIHTQRGLQWVPTGQTSYAQARALCTEHRVQEMQMAACGGILTAEVISRLLTGRRFSVADILAAWKQDALVDLGPDTCAAYEGTLRQWLAFGEHARQSLSAIPRRQLHAFVNEPRTSAGTRRGRLSALRSFYTFASASGYCVGNPADLIRVQTRDLLFAELEPKKTAPITEAEYRALMASARLKGFYRFATALGYWLGLRLRDIACFQPASLQENVCTIYQQKTGGRLALPLDDPLLGAGELHRILLEIVEQTPPGAKFCFPEKRDIAQDPARRAQLSVAYGRILRRHGICGKRFHSLRHAYAMRLKAAGLTLEQIAGRMGHASTSSTKVYTEHE